jgi:hypothetical protein
MVERWSVYKHGINENDMDSTKFLSKDVVDFELDVCQDESGIARRNRKRR